MNANFATGLYLILVLLAVARWGVLKKHKMWWVTDKLTLLNHVAGGAFVVLLAFAGDAADWPTAVFAGAVLVINWIVEREWQASCLFDDQPLPIQLTEKGKRHLQEGDHIKYAGREFRVVRKVRPGNDALQADDKLD